MLSGDNGILQKATDAKTKSDEAQIKERIQLAYHSALAKDITGENGELTMPTLQAELNNEFSGRTVTITPSADNKEWTIKVDNVEETIPAGKEVEEKVVGSSSDWQLNDSKDTIIAYIGGDIDGDTFVIPNYVDDNKIISIGNGSAPIWAEKFSNPNEFMNGKKLKISDGIENIRYNAFVSSFGLNGDIIFPESIKTIESCAFASCNNMTGKLYIGKNVQINLNVGNGASPFAGCSFNEIEIHIKNIPNGLFSSRC